MRPGSVVLIRMPETGGAPPKLRPVLVLVQLPGAYQELLVCGISTRFADLEPDWDEVLGPSDPDFASSGLHRASVVRPSFLAAVESSAVAGRIGDIDPVRLERVRGRLARLLSGEPPRQPT